MSYTYKGAPIWSVGVTLLIPGLITHLSLYPRTQILRMGLLPIALWGFWIILWSYRFETPDDATLLELSMLFTLSAGIRYTFTTAPTAHPLPRQPPLGFLRNNNIFETFNLLASEFRHINIPPNPPLPPRNKAGQSGRGYFSSITYHSTNMIFHLTLLDIILYPAYILDPTGVGSPYPGGGGDLSDFCGRYGSFGWIVWGWMIFAAGAGLCVATMGTYHLCALIGVGSGIWIDEEFPRFMDQPWRADSLNDLWGRRYHQLLRDTFILWAKPFETLPKTIYILTIFLASAFFHIIISIPFDNSTPTAYLVFYTSQGVGCILERVYRKITGKRVSGWSGRIWTWGWLMLWAGSMVPEYYRTGWVGMMRGSLHEGGMSPADALVKWLRREG